MKPAKNLKSIITEEKYAKLFTWEITTSKSSNHWIPGNELAKESFLEAENAYQRPKYVYMGLLDRTCGNRMNYALYRFIVLFNNSVWYYFAPFFLSYGGFVWIMQ